MGSAETVEKLIRVIPAELRSVMKKFELCYRLADPHTEQWLAPQLLLPSKPPELANWAKPDDLVLRYKYPFLPRGLVRVCAISAREHQNARYATTAKCQGGTVHLIGMHDPRQLRASPKRGRTGSDPLRRGQKLNENDSPPKGQTLFRTGSKAY